MGRKVKSAVFHFKPFSRKQKQILTWWLPESGVSDYNGIIADGAVRSGKTVCMVLSFILWSMMCFDGENFAMCGKTIGAFRRNVLAPLKKMLLARGYRYVDHRADNMIEVSRGGKTNYYYIFGGKDERSQDLIQGITLAGILFDEVALMPQSFVDQAVARCSVSGAKLWFNCNPGAPNHWFKTEWLDKLDKKRLLHLHFLMDDNLSLDEETKQRYRTMFSAKVFFRRFILGEWCLAEGLIYEQFANDEERYLIPRDRVPPLSYIEIGADVGGNKSNHAYVAAGYTAARDVMYVLKALSYKATGTTVTQYRDKLLTFADAVKEDYGFVDSLWIDNAEAAIVNEVAAHSPYSVRGSIKGEIIDRVRCADILLSEDRIKLVDGTCEDLRAGLRTAVWDEDHEDTPLDDGTYDRDVIDAFDYSMTPHIVQLLRG